MIGGRSSHSSSSLPDPSSLKSIVEYCGREEGREIDRERLRESKRGGRGRNEGKVRGKGRKKKGRGGTRIQQSNSDLRFFKSVSAGSNWGQKSIT